MTPQELADELARLAGWKKRPIDLCIMGATPWYKPAAGPRDPGDSRYAHPYTIGSLDALEAFRRERLPGIEWACVFGSNTYVTTWDAYLKLPAFGSGHGPDEWTARASALVAAAREESK